MEGYLVVEFCGYGCERLGTCTPPKEEDDVQQSLEN